MLEYNTDHDKLRLPEYGRTIQSLIDYCVGIENREERTECAYSIAAVMANLFPNLKGDDNDMSKVWDQMMIMSQFKLDVDFPCEVITEEKFAPGPSRIEYENAPIRLRHYGKLIERMIPVIASMEDGPEKEDLISMVAHQMKKLRMFQDKDAVDDSRILRDLAMYSDGKIELDPEQYYLADFKEAAVASKGQGKKKNKKI